MIYNRATVLVLTRTICSFSTSKYLHRWTWLLKVEVCRHNWAHEPPLCAPGFILMRTTYIELMSHKMWSQLVEWQCGLVPKIMLEIVILYKTIYHASKLYHPLFLKHIFWEYLHVTIGDSLRVSPCTLPLSFSSEDHDQFLSYIATHPDALHGHPWVDVCGGHRLHQEGPSPGQVRAKGRGDFPSHYSEVPGPEVDGAVHVAHAHDETDGLYGEQLIWTFSLLCLQIPN